MRMYSFDTNGFTETANQIKEVLVDFMAGEGLITHDQAREVKRNWAVVIKEKNFFGKLWDKWRGQEDHTGATIAVMRACQYASVNLEDPPEDEQEEEQTEQTNTAPPAGRFDLEVG